ncbi:ATP-binding cassette domain-containing protein [Alkalibacillus sp. S2W]|uniref:ATP-binding cassette domain-containing protein n=1 Tax=Alkalibacillus sp. S2W TaxID=3386553 RepID=UPI00398D13AE
MNATIETHQLKKVRDDFTLGPLDVAIESGLVTAFVGHNGSGKSTLLKSIMSLVKPTSGDIQVLDTNITQSENWKKEIAYLPQDKLGFGPFNGHQLRELIADLYPNWDNELFHRLVHDWNIPLSKKFHSMSPGMQQKLALALTISRGTPIMILDEPSAHIDLASRHILFDVLSEWMEDGERTLIIATHHIEDIRKLADIIAVMKEGQLIAQEDKDSIAQTYTQYWLTGELPNETLPGEVKRHEQSIITDQPASFEQYLNQHDQSWFKKESLSLEDTLAFMLTI